MIKILCVSSMPPAAPSGVVTHYKRLHTHFLDDPDVSVDLVTVADASWAHDIISGLIRRFISAFAFNNKKIIKLSIETKQRLMIYFALKKHKNKDYHIIHAQDILSGCTTKRFFKNKIPLVLTCHFNDNPVEEDLLTYNFGLSGRKYLANAYKHKFAAVNKFIFVSKYAHEKSKYLLNGATDMEVIYNGVEFSSFENRKNNNGVLEIINVGSVEERKNQKILISLAKRLIHEKIFNFHITVIGAGPDLPHIISEINEAGLNKYFLFPGWITNVDEYLKKSNLYIHTSINDNCPYAILEAISKEVPVIAFRVGGIPEIVDKQFLFELNDVENMTEFIIKNRSNLPQISKEQFDKISKVFSIENQLDRTKELYLAFS